MENSLKQYTELYQQHEQLVRENAPEALNRLRPKALSHLLNTTLPRKGSEEYEHIDLNALLSVDYGLNLQRLPLPVNPAASFKCDVPNVTTALFFNINDTLQPSDTAAEALAEDTAKGALIGSLAEIAVLHPEIIEKYLGSEAPLDNPLTALNTLLAQDGMVVYVPRGIKLSHPLQLVNILQNGMPLMAVRRLLIVLEDDAEAQMLVCDHTQNPDMDFMSLQTIEIIVGRGAKLGLYDLEESTTRTVRLSQLYMRQEADSEVRIAGITLFNGTSRNEYVTRFCGRHASLWLGGMAIEDEKRYAETYSLIQHDVPECKTEELFKHVSDEDATTVFSGRILVAEGAVHTEAYQQNRNLSSSPTARIFSKPQLEIYNDDVKCSHGSATGCLDPMEIFYMRSRGLSEETATKLLKQAFMADVIDNVQLPGLKERLTRLVERRFAGHKSVCGDCSLSSTTNGCHQK